MMARPDASSRGYRSASVDPGGREGGREERREGGRGDGDGGEGVAMTSAECRRCRRGSRSQGER